MLAAGQLLLSKGLFRSDEFNVRVLRGKDEWVVSFTFLPLRVGNEVTVILTRDAKVKAWAPML